MAATNTEPIYSAEQIRIPAEFPDLLKNYSKFIIRKQPLDIIAASAECASHNHNSHSLRHSYFNRLNKSGAKDKSRLSDMQLELLYTKVRFYRWRTEDGS